MRFCDQCGSLMQKNPMPAGGIEFRCQCNNVIEGDATDTLMAEIYLEASQSNVKHEIMIENSSFDPAANHVMLGCRKCKRDYLTMIRVGVTETVMYTCQCGYRATRAEYLRNM